MGMKLLLFILIVTLPVLSETSPCKGNPKVIGQCFSVHGRVTYGPGTPALRIWRIGTNRMLGITAGAVADDADDPILPKEMQQFKTGVEGVYGDFEVCPFTSEKPGSMQMVCVESATHLVVQPYWKNTNRSDLPQPEPSQRNASPAVAQPSSVAEKSDVVWTWSKRCNGDNKLAVTVRLDGKVLYRGVLPICRGSRDAEDGRVEFQFAGGHTFQREYHTRSTDAVEVNIWQAGGEPDALILGISFDTNKQILLNTLHISRPEKQMSSELDKGLFITTYPAPVR
jgi:hypothetical protein